MRRIVASALVLVAALCGGCASVTHGTTHSLRIDTVTAAGETVDNAECTLTNDHGTTLARSGTASPVRRSRADLDIRCAAPGQPDAKARLVSRANVGLAGNIVLGGAIGAVIDHNTGAAYTYPGWVRLVFGHFGVFDRREEQDGVAMTSTGGVLVQGASSGGTAAVATQAAPATPVSTQPAAATAPAPQAAAATPPLGTALAQGDSFDYRITDRASHRTSTVVLRADRVEGNEVSFNSGARVEATNGTVLRITSMLAGELDQVTPPGGWMLSGRTPGGSWKMKHRSLVPASGMSYDLDASVEGEQKLLVQGRELRTLRIALRGWAENRNPAMTARARYEGTAWLSPELRRVVRYEARSRASANSSARFDIDETIELVRIGRD